MAYLELAPYAMTRLSRPSQPHYGCSVRHYAACQFQCSEYARAVPVLLSH